jgi:hypothetical protein
MSENAKSHPQGDLFGPGYEELTPERRAADAKAYEKLMSERQARYEEKAERKADLEHTPVTKTKPLYPLEIIQFNEFGQAVPSPKHREWLHRQAQLEDARRGLQSHEQSGMDLWPDLSS